MSVKAIDNKVASKSKNKNKKEQKNDWGGFFLNAMYYLLIVVLVALYMTMANWLVMKSDLDRLYPSGHNLYFKDANAGKDTTNNLSGFEKVANNVFPGNAYGFPYTLRDNDGLVDLSFKGLSNWFANMVANSYQVERSAFNEIFGKSRSILEIIPEPIQLVCSSVIFALSYFIPVITLLTTFVFSFFGSGISWLYGIVFFFIPLELTTALINYSIQIIQSTIVLLGAPVLLGNKFKDVLLSLKNHAWLFGILYGALLVTDASKKLDNVGFITMLVIYLLSILKMAYNTYMSSK
jgi:hypothetical protein